jgi:hypothetical protein
MPLQNIRVYCSSRGSGLIVGFACAGEWTTVFLPWHEFVGVKRARVDPASPALDPAKVRQLGLVLSRFEYNGAPNPKYRAGKFTLEVRPGLCQIHSSLGVQSLSTGLHSPVLTMSTLAYRQIQPAVPGPIILYYMLHYSV